MFAYLSAFLFLTVLSTEAEMPIHARRYTVELDTFTSYQSSMIK